MKNVLHSKHSQALERPWAKPGLPEQCPEHAHGTSQEDSLSWKTLVSGWGDGTCAAHTVQQQIWAERGRGVTEVCPARGWRRCWQCTCLAKLTLLLARQDFSLPAPHFQAAKHSANISSARIYAEGTECCQNKHWTTNIKPCYMKNDLLLHNTELYKFI